MGSSNTGSGAKEEIPMEEPVNAEPLELEYPNASVFSEGEKVLAYHCGLIYEAKINRSVAEDVGLSVGFSLVKHLEVVIDVLGANSGEKVRTVQKTEFRKDEWKYFVHYLGWNKNWDEWVGTDRLLKYTDENLNKQVLLKSQSSDKLPKSSRPAQIKPKSSNDEKVDKEDLKNNAARGKKKKTSEDEVLPKEKDTKSQEKHMLLQFPLTLKKQLVDDWEFVTQLGKLVKLPRSPNVDDILKKYLDYREKKDAKVADPVAQMLKGLRSYFDKALPAMLLYKKERQQYHEACDDISPSTVYGAEHLLRLFVKLPELLCYVNMEEEASENLQQNLLDFLKYLQKNQSCFFLSTYDGFKNSEEADDKRR